MSKDGAPCGTGSRPTDQAPAGLGAPRFDPSRISDAVSLVDASQLQPIIRKAAEQFYEAVLGTAEDYLRDNLDWNLKAHLSMLETENQRMRTELHEVGQIIGPPWLTHSERLLRLRHLEEEARAAATLRYEAAFPHATATIGKPGNATAVSDPARDQHGQ